jgi:deazaflavin-dependent oxidoreductase (nitroreductase family)
MDSKDTNVPRPADSPVQGQEPTEEGTAAASTPLPDGGSPSAPRAQTLAYQGAANRLIRGLLRTPLLCRVVGKWLMTVYVVGRKSGRRYAIPVAYTRHNGYLLAGTPFGWGRNLRTGEPVQVRLKGRRRTADVQVITDEVGVVENYATMARDNPQFAKFNKIGFDEAGNPNPTDLQLAWAAGARAFRFTPR